MGKPCSGKVQRRSGAVLLLGIILLAGCQTRPEPTPPAGQQAGETAQLVLPHIARRRETGRWDRGKLESLPAYGPRSTPPFGPDLRGYDLTSLDLTGRLDDLLHADFDSQTKWPDRLPPSFDPAFIMELGKNPGLGVRWLHAAGITGKGVGIGLVDQTLLADHEEYRDRLEFYEEINCSDLGLTMHGATAASTIVGKTVGVAPEADLYYVAQSYGMVTPTGLNEDATWVPKAVEHLLEVNRLLPEGRKIRAIAVIGGTASKGEAEMEEAVRKTRAQGILVPLLSRTSKFIALGLGRHPLRDPDSLSSYGPSSSWAEWYFAGRPVPLAGALLAPMDARCVASATGVSDYVFYCTGGSNWAECYVAGLYALACQVKPDVTPEEFWAAALKTSDTVRIVKDGKEYRLEGIVNPARLIDALR